MNELLARIYFGNPVADWLLAAVAFAVVFTVLPVLRRYVVARGAALATGGLAPWAELTLLLIRQTSRFFLIALAIYAAERFLQLPPKIDRVSTTVLVLVVWLQAALWGTTAVGFALRQRQERAVASGEARSEGSLNILMFVARLLLFSTAILLALDNLGVNITALVAGLGVGGIAVALAVQTILGDVLGSLSITLDRPYEVGDWLRVDDIEGAVEFISIRSTRIRSVSGEQIIISNADMLKSRVHNLGRMSERRTLMTIGIAYETSPDKLATVSSLVERAVHAVDGTRFEYCYLKTYGDSALQFELVYFVPDPNDVRLKYNRVNDLVLRGIHAAFAAQGIEFAYPTRTLIVRNAAP
ncbi:MAG: mechanosensitive ion channel family protein [Gammaproteobacteria bacterium]|jgi:small-conductance mechanosensitive channel|nr:mechanosensitive ion channel family protein [Gammaproteobacteria bacterium]NBX40004.1 mechanosensitive ion channel family protein [Gammaproteobacteria bacterium]